MSSWYGLRIRFRVSQLVSQSKLRILSQNPRATCHNEIPKVKAREIKSGGLGVLKCLLLSSYFKTQSLDLVI